MSVAAGVNTFKAFLRNVIYTFLSSLNVSEKGNHLGFIKRKI